MKADIIAVRPPGETPTYSWCRIMAELKTAGIDTEKVKITNGIIQPDGSKTFNVFLRGSVQTARLEE